MWPTSKGRGGRVGKGKRKGRGGEAKGK